MRTRPMTPKPRPDPLIAAGAECLDDTALLP